MVENHSRNGGKSFEKTDISGYVCHKKVIVSSVDFYFRRLCTPKKMASFPPLRPFPFCLASVKVRAPSGVVVEEIETLPMSLTLKLKVGKHRQLGAWWVPDGVFFLHMKAPWILGVLQKTPVGVLPHEMWSRRHEQKSKVNEWKGLPMKVSSETRFPQMVASWVEKDLFTFFSISKSPNFPRFDGLVVNPLFTIWCTSSRWWFQIMIF